MVTNETLAAMLKVQHEAVTQRLEELTEQVRETNGRLRKAETTIAVLEAAPKQTTITTPVNNSQVMTGIAVAGAAVWGVVQVLFKLGDVLKALGLR